MSHTDERKKNQRAQRPSLPEMIQEVLERLREGVDALAQELGPRPQRVPIPVETPVYRRRNS